MADVNDKIRFLDTLRNSQGKFLPIVDHAWKVFPKENTGTEWYDDPEYNLGWDAGLVDGNRPYFAECWATNGITMLTYFVSTRGIEDASTEDLVRMLTDAHLFRLLDPGNPRTAVMKFEDDTGNEFYSINVTAVVEDDLYVEGGACYPFGPLNEYNERKMKGEKPDDGKRKDE